MPLPLRHIPIGALLGDDESIPSIGLPVAFSSGGSKNLYIDQNGVATAILGYTKQNVAAIVSNTGAAAMRIRALYHYIKQAAGVLTRQEIGIFDDAAAHFEFRYSTDLGITWTFVGDLGAGSIGTIPAFAQSGNSLVMTNGVLAPQQWDGAALTAVSSTQLVAPAITSAGVNTGQKVGNYQFRVVPIKSDGTRKVASLPSNVLFVNGEKINVAWAADTDVTVSGYEVYSTNGTGKVFYIEGAVTGRLTVAFAANTADADLLANRALQEYGDAPPVGIYFCAMHKERMWYGRTNTDPRKWYFSDAGLPFSVYKEQSYIDMTDAESMSDFSTGGTGNYKGMFVAWLERSVWTVSGTGAISGAIIDWYRRRTSAQVGTVSHRTVARVPTGAKFIDASGKMSSTADNTLAYLTPFGDIRIFDGDNDTVISAAKSTTLKRLNYLARNKAYVVVDTPRSEFTWVMPFDTSAEPSYAVTWNWKFGVWYERTWSFGYALQLESSSTASTLLGGESDLAKGAFVYLLWNGTTFDGTAIAWQFMTKTLYGTGQFQQDDPGESGAALLSYQKRWRWVDILFKVTGRLNLTVEWLPGEASDSQSGIASVASVGSLIQDASGQPLQSADLQQLFAVLSPSIVRARFMSMGATFSDGKPNGRYQYSRGMRLRISAASTTALASILGLDIAYQALPGLRRTFRQ